MKGVLCRHIKSVWQVLMALTVLCVAIQILGVVWQSRNYKMLNEKMLNERVTNDIQRTPPESEQWDWKRLRSLPAPVVEEDVRSQEERVSKQLAEYEHGREKPGQEGKVTEVSNPFNTLKDSKKQAGNKVISLTGLSKVTLGNNTLHARVPWSVAVRPSEGAVGHSARSGPPTMPGRPLHLQSTNQPKRRNSPAFLGTSSLRARSTYRNNVKSLTAGLISDVEPVVASTTCQPKNHVVFLKTHKTGSSTILNILYRYGDSRNLSFALPLNRHSQLFYPYLFAPHFVEGFRGGRVREFHIMCNHMRFKRAEVVKVMPQETFYFSILRNPVAMMESVFNYYKGIPAFNKMKSLEDFFNNGSRTFNNSLPNNHYARNLLTFDFGFDNDVPAFTTEDLETQVALIISTVEQDFHLILLTEYFDESMILLRHALCWSLDDVVSFKLNSRREGTRQALSRQTAVKIRGWNALDWRLYLHFNATFWRRVDVMVGREKMRDEVNQLQDRRAELAQMCLQGGGAVDPSKVKDVGLKPFQSGAAVIEGYNLNPGLDGPSKTLCQSLITPELQYTDILYAKQFPELVAKQIQTAKMAAKQASSQRRPGSAKVRVREGRYIRLDRSGPTNVRHQNALPIAHSTHTATRSRRNMP